MTVAIKKHLSRRERERKELRFKILEAGRALFSLGGENALTLRRVAEKIEFSATAIYAHFPHKEALLLEICETELAIFNRSLQQAGHIPDPVSRLSTLARLYIDFGLEHPEHYRVLFMRETSVPMDSQVSSTSSGDTAVDQGKAGKSGLEMPVSSSAERLAGIYEHLYQAFFKAMAAGCFRPEYRDVTLLSQALWSCLHGVVALHLIRANHSGVPWKPVQSLADFSVEALLNGLTNASHQLPPTWRR